MTAGDILVKAHTVDDLISFRTYERGYGGHGRFLVSARLLELALIDTEQKLYHDSDCGNIVQFYHQGALIKFSFFWLTYHSDRQISGIKQNLAIHADAMVDAVFREKPLTLLCRPPEGGAKIDASRVPHKLQYILSDKHKRRAFSKAMRDCFNWQGDTVHLLNDSGDDFYFTTDSGFPANGGLVLHHSTRNGYPYIYYSVHT